MIKKVEERKDTFITDRKHLENLSKDELKAKFWSLIDEIIDPLLDLAYEETSESVERSVLLRMGFSSLEAKQIVQVVQEKGLLSKGAGHVVYVISNKHGISIHEAGMKVLDGKTIDEVILHFQEVK